MWCGGSDKSETACRATRQGLVIPTFSPPKRSVCPPKKGDMESKGWVSLGLMNHTPIKPCVEHIRANGTGCLPEGWTDGFQHPQARNHCPWGGWASVQAGTTGSWVSFSGTWSEEGLVCQALSSPALLKETISFQCQHAWEGSLGDPRTPAWGSRTAQDRTVPVQVLGDLRGGC